jgi:phosphomethylpyrimidine synthase
MNTRLSGSARVDSTNVLPSGEIRGLTKLVKITEEVRKYAAEHGVTEHQAIEFGMKDKSKEFTEKGSELYAKA